MNTTGIIIAILLLGLFLSPSKTLGGLKNIGLPKWSKKLKSSARWEISGHELFARARIVKWLLLAILKMGLLAFSCFCALFQIAFDAAKTLMPKALKA